ncbi:flavin reductase family protein [Haliscomenobacter hydrossis]|uniref:Flavin reductase domain protein FMN-binding protein n=1 Tax=Haliscomenobacter hydrossis (strain ATCC 27775 / DSM 1100 / LMG 10767 / O) TaxID=760192 RepID=F4KPF1_HALH1|nr:flavin reductase family protein [Haliscomenobacter hydrossis]AEE49905.1 flavin reductase domain protein FMN-binding protein [Haliscomenobacter hydrossis DSM 1100]
MAIKTIDPNNISIPELQGYLQAAVAPRPIAFASTVDKDGQVNLSPFSFFNMFSTNPPILIFSPSRRVRGNTTKHSLDNVLEIAEVCINVVNYPMVEQMSLASTEYEKGVNEFVKAGFTQVPSTLIQAPRVGEAPVAFECKVLQVLPLGTEGGAGNLVICQVILIHVQEQYLDEAGRLDTTKIDLVARMGGNWYARAFGDALFEIPKPLFTRGIGIDALPEAIRNSTVLTGNNLGRLGNIEVLPGSPEIELMKNDAEVAEALTKGTDALHRLAQLRLEAGNTEEALKILLLK